MGPLQSDLSYMQFPLGSRSTALGTLPQMVRFVVGLPILPHLPGDGQPPICQATIGARLVSTVGEDIAPIGERPTRAGNRGFGELLRDAPELFVAATTEDDDLSPAACFGDRTGTSEGLDTGRSRETIPMIAELGEQGRSQ